MRVVSLQTVVVRAHNVLRFGRAAPYLAPWSKLGLPLAAPRHRRKPVRGSALGPPARRREPPPPAASVRTGPSSRTSWELRSDQFCGASRGRQFGREKHRAVLGRAVKEGGARGRRHVAARAQGLSAYKQLKSGARPPAGADHVLIRGRGRGGSLEDPLFTRAALAVLMSSAPRGAVGGLGGLG